MNNSTTSTVSYTYSNCSILDEIYELKKKVSELERKFNDCKCKCCGCCRHCKPRPIYEPWWGSQTTYTNAGWTSNTTSGWKS